MDVQGRLDVNFRVLEETHTMSFVQRLEEVWYLLLSRHVKVH